MAAKTLLTIFWRILLPVLWTIHVTHAVPFSANVSNNDATSSIGVPPTPGFLWHNRAPIEPRAKLPLTSILFLTLDILEEFALQSWRGHVISRTGQSGKYKGVAITVQANPKQHTIPFEVRHAMWGLWLSAMDIAFTKDYTECAYKLWYQRDRGGDYFHVGAIGYTTPQQPREKVSASLGSDDRDDLEIVDTEQVSRRDEAARHRHADDALLAYGTPLEPAHGLSQRADELSTGAFNISNTPYTTTISSTGKTVPLQYIFSTVYQAIVDKASQPDRSPSKTYHYYTQDTNLRIGFQVVPDVEEVPSYELAIAALGQLPEAMRERGVFGECTFLVSDARRGLLDGYLKIGRAA